MGAMLYSYEAVQVGLSAGISFTATAKRFQLLASPTSDHPKTFLVMADAHCYLKQGDSSVTATSNDIRLQEFQPMVITVTTKDNSYLSVLRASSDSGTLKCTLLRIEPHEMSLLLDGTQYASITDASQTNLDITGSFSAEAATKFTALGSSNSNALALSNPDGDTGADIATVVIQDGSQTGLDITGDICIECWAKWTRTNQATMALVAKHYLSSTLRGYQFYFSSASGGTLRLQISSDGSAGNTDTLSVSFIPTTGTWYHVAVSWVAATSTASFYVDGVLTGSAQVGVQTSINNNAQPLRIGSNGGSTAALSAGSFDGEIDDVRIWNTTRTITQIANNRLAQLPGSTTGLAASWRFNGTLTDETANANTLSALGDTANVTYVTTVPFDAVATFASKTTIGDDNNYGWQFYYDPAGNLGFRFGPSTTTATWRTFTAAWSPTAGIWYHVAATITFSGSTAVIRLYASTVENGVYVLLGTSTALSASAIRNVNSDFQVGGAYNGSTSVHNLDGQIKNVRLWSGNVLSLAQLNAMRLLTLGGAAQAGSASSNFAFNGDPNDTEGDNLTLNGGPMYQFDAPFNTVPGNAVL